MLLAERAKNGRIDIFDEKLEEIVFLILIGLRLMKRASIKL